MKHKLFAGIVWLSAVQVSVANAQQRPTLQPPDYEQWETLNIGSLAPNGEWLAVPISRVNGDNELRIHRLTGEDSVRVVAQGDDPAFSADSRWLVYRVGVSETEQERKEAAREPVHFSVGILNLTTGEEIVVADVATHALSPSGHYLAMARYGEEGSDRKPDLLVRDLARRRNTNFGNVSTFAWSENGDMLAMAIETLAGGDNGLHVYEPALDRLRVLTSGGGVYKRLSWREDADDLAAVEASEGSTGDRPIHVIHAWRDLSTSTPQTRFVTADALSSDSNFVIAEHKLDWSDDGRRLFIGLQDVPVQSPKQNAASDTTVQSDSSKSNVQVWHARDVRIYPMQRAQEARDRERSVLAVWEIDAGVIRNLHTDRMSDVSVVPGDQYATEQIRSPYYALTQFGRDYSDVHLIDVNTGARRTVIERVRHFFGASPEGRYLLYFDASGYWVVDTKTSARTNLAPTLASTLTNMDYDYPVELFPPYGFAGWVANDSAILVYDEFDVWMVSTEDGVAKRVTDGRPDEIVYRLQRVDREDALPPDVPIYYSLFGKKSKKSGYAMGNLDGDVTRLRYENVRATRLAKADSTDVYVFAEERFDDSPDYFVAGPRLNPARQVTHTNPFQRDFAWGKAELIEYRDPKNRVLHGVLLYPPHHDPSRRYPMIVYQYEVLSHQLHVYTVPTERRYYNTTVWNQHGYFVLLPDIMYTGREPGISALHAIDAAIDAVVQRNVIDPDRIGLIGHSWGGYQATFLPTQTDRFAAAVAGAPLTNFLSMMGAVHWRPGLPETGHWETGQARMEVPFWEDFEAHVRNSPAAHIANLNTPMLMMFGDDDGTVDFRQGVEFYNYARRAGKDDFVMLVYPDEDHGLRKRENQVDYHRRILQWFDHYLRGGPAAPWITDGVAFLDQHGRQRN